MLSKTSSVILGPYEWRKARLVKGAAIVMRVVYSDSDLYLAILPLPRVSSVLTTIIQNTNLANLRHW